MLFSLHTMAVYTMQKVAEYIEEDPSCKLQAYLSELVILMGPEFKSRSAVELIPGGVNSACHPSEVGKMSGNMLVSYVGVATRPGLCPIAKETA